jgi:hypothetical protein
MCYTLDGLEKAMDVPIGTSVTGVAVQTEKIILWHEQGDSPDLSPLFANNVELVNVGSDYYLDVGIIRPEDIMAAGIQQMNNAEKKVTKLEFFVVQRIAMSEHTFRMLMSRGQVFLSHLNAREKSSESSSPSPSIQG